MVDSFVSCVSPLQSHTYRGGGAGESKGGGGGGNESDDEGKGQDYYVGGHSARGGGR